MPDINREKDALLTDHLSYTPLSLIDDIINAVNTIVYQALDAIEDGLLNVPPAQLGFKSSSSESGDATQAARDEIENGVHQLETLLESTVDKSFDKFEIYTLRSILSVSDDLDKYIRLKHYEGLQLPPPESAPTPESIHHLRRQVQETTKLNLALKSREAQNAALISQLNAMLSSPKDNNTETTGSLAFLTTPIGSDSNTTSQPLTTRTQFATSQLPALRQLIAELRPKVAKLKNVDPSDVDWNSRKEERRQYIEGGVRRVVGKGGFGAGEGDLKAGEGERRPREEVEMLEGVVRAMGNGVGSGSGREDRMES